MSPSTPTGGSFGALLRAWRTRRCMSQLDLACAAGSSTRHLSFLETGRANPSREMALTLAEHLGMPLRERNRLLLAAGFAPHFPDRALAQGKISPDNRALTLVLCAQEPWPALAVDRHWHLIEANRAVPPLLEGVAPDLLQPPINVLRLSLHPDGLAPRIVNFAEWRSHVLRRLRLEVGASADPALERLHAELAALPTPLRSRAKSPGVDLGGLATSFVLETSLGLLNLFTTTTVFGTATDVTFDELTLESFVPADEASGERLRALYGAYMASDAPNLQAAG